MAKPLFTEDFTVVNVGVPSFADSIRQAGGNAVSVDWAPPAQGDREIGMRLANLLGDPRIDAANAEALDRFLAAEPILRRVGVAKADIPNMGERMILHSGPPVSWDVMAGPMRGAVIGAIMLEGWADDLDRAAQLAASGEITFEPNHHHSSVGPMAGVVSPSMPVWVVENTKHGNVAYTNMNEGLGKVLRMGANEPAVIDRLRWMRDTLAPAMGKALDVLGGVELKPLIAQALHMGDECHNRNVAASSLLLNRFAPALMKTDVPPADIAKSLEFIAGNVHFFVNISMASCKAMLDAAHGIPHSTMLTVMARNGYEFGIRLSGTGDQWFTAPAPQVDGLYFAGFTAADASRDIGDSAITETAGIGGFAMGTAPAIVRFVGGTPQDAIRYTREMGHITLGTNQAFTLPPLSFAGTPTGIDARKVVDTGICPVINTGIAHRDPGVGQVGAGITHAPLECFIKAIRAFPEPTAE